MKYNNVRVLIISILLSKLENIPPCINCQKKKIRGTILNPQACFTRNGDCLS